MFKVGKQALPVLIKSFCERGKMFLDHPVDGWMAVFPTKFNRRLKHIGRLGGVMRTGSDKSAGKSNTSIDLRLKFAMPAQELTRKLCIMPLQ